jgi:hypothetical protein
MLRPPASSLVQFAILILQFSIFNSSLPAGPVYQPAGAPVDPKVPAQWNRYHDYAAASELLKALADAHPHRCALTSMGRSYGGREMWVLTITNPDTGPAESKPAFWMDGGIHANEIQGPEVVLYTAWFLLEMDGRSEFITRLLRERTFYLMPMLSPDGRDAHMYEPNTTHSPRSGLRPVDDDKDGLVDEDGPDDIDGDGHITMMRIRDPHGRFRAHERFADLLVPTGEDEELREGEARYTLLGPEGVDNDGDGKVNEDGDGYYDPNRDWPWQWQPPYVQGGAHRYPLSILENRMAADFILSRPNIAAAQDHASRIVEGLRGPGAEGDRYEPADLRIFDVLGKRGERMLPGYRYLELRKDLYPAHGAEIDWLYAMRGITAFTNELFTAFNYFRQREHPAASGPDAWFGTELSRREFERDLLLGDGFVPWREVDHPTYGRIEVGGPRKNWSRQPPSFLLEEECHRNMAFCLYHADQMPRVKVAAVQVQRLGTVMQITATIANERLIPTRLAIDVQRKITPPDRVTLAGEGVRILTGLVSDEPFFLNARQQKLRPAVLNVDMIPGRGAVYVRWLVEGEGPFTVQVDSARGGRDGTTVPGDGGQ